MYAYQVRVDPARAKSNVRTILGDRVDQLWRFGYGRRQIGVGKKRDVAASLVDAALYAEPLASIRVVRQKPQVAIERPVLLDTALYLFGGIILRAVVYDYDFRIVLRSGQEAQHLIQSSPDPFPFVISRYDYR